MDQQTLLDSIERETYHIDAQEVGGEMAWRSFCVLQLTNGFCAVAHSDGVPLENFNPEDANAVSYSRALDKIEPLLTYVATYGA